MDRNYSTYGDEKHRILLGRFYRKRQHGGLVHMYEIRLNCALKEQSVQVWTRFNWLWIDPRSKLL
jgi:hypothetical protein